MLCVSAIGPNAARDDVVRLVASLDIRGRYLDVTGILIVSASGLLQALEGHLDAVNDVLAQFDLESCHGRWHMLSCEATLHRKFARWSMTVAEEPAASTVCGLIDGSIRPRRVLESLQLRPLPAGPLKA